jgi:hypothetical protein
VSGAGVAGSISGVESGDGLSILRKYGIERNEVNASALS